MSTGHKQVVREFIDILNDCRWDDAVQFYVDHFKEDFYFLGEAWINRGMYLVKSNGKAIAKEITGPVKDKLQEGDEIIQVREGDRVYRTPDSLVYGPWGQRPSEQFHVEARRDGEAISFDYAPVVMPPQSNIFPYPLEEWRKACVDERATLSELHYDVEYMLEEGNLVSIFLLVSGFNKKHRRPCAYSEAEVWEFEGDKVARIIETRNTCAEQFALGDHMIPPGDLEILEAQTVNEFDLDLFKQQFIRSMNSQEIALSDRQTDEIFSNDLIQQCVSQNWLAKLRN